jgi:hypothetical protein
MMFVRAPERGAVKSRLATSVGEDVALELYKCFVRDMVEMLARGRQPFTIFFHPPESRQRVVQWLGDKYTLLPQVGDDLGERMKNAFKMVFSEGLNYALLIGSDSPDLPSLLIDEAFASLKDHDAVVGPSHDGGYYLIGFRADTFLPQVFDGIFWSTPEVFLQTLDVLKKARRGHTHILPKWRDIDTLDDLKVLFSNCRNTPFAKSATIRYMVNNKCAYYE